MLYLCPIYDQDYADKFLIYPWDMLAISVINKAIIDQMTALGTNGSLTFTFVTHSQIAYHNEQLL